ncbi:MAG: serine/threonine protein kinase [Planctomycetaceae bacterium]|nr:serine/threonine protein kinase [Planctomycetaceae bacterium]
MNPPPDPPNEHTVLEAEPPVPVRQIGQYDLFEQIGRGGMGVVWKGRHRHLGQTVAVKLLLPGSWTDDRAISRFYREMRAGGRVLNDHVVRAVDAGEYGGEHVLVMEYVEGQTLGALLSATGPFPQAMACEAIRQAALGVAAIHHHEMTHRDLKPSNLFLTREGVVKVLDLGLARLPAGEDAGDSPEEELTHTGLLLGTIDYMAPEQTQDARDVDPRTDLYSLGCTLYALLVGSPPFRGQAQTLEDRLRIQREVQPQPLKSLLPYVSEELSDLVQQLLSKQPGDRIQTAEELVERLEKFSHGADLRQWQTSLREDFSDGDQGQPRAENQSSRPVTAADVDTSQLTGESNTWNGFGQAAAPAGAGSRELPGTVISSMQQPLATSDAAGPAPARAGSHRRWLRSVPLAAAAAVLLLATLSVPLLGRALSLVTPEPPSADGGEVNPTPPPETAPEGVEEPPAATVETVRLQDFTEVTPLRLHSLLEQEPVPIFWQNEEGLSNWDWNPDLQQVLLSCEETGLLGFGTTQSDDFQLQVGLHQNRWTSGSGVFLGLQGWDPEQPDAEWSCFWLHLVERTSRTGLSQWEIQLSQVVSRLDGKGYWQVVPSSFASEPIASQLYAEAMLELSIQRGRLLRIRLNGQSFRELVSAANSQAEQHSWRGGFGTMVGSGAVTVRNARYMSTATRP